MLLIEKMYHKRKSKEMPENEIKSKAESLRKEREENGDALPTAITRLVLTNFGVGGLITIACVACALSFRNMGFLIGLVYAAYLVVNGVNAWIDYRHGKVQEKVLLCSSLTKRITGMQIIMQDVTAEPIQFYEFVFPKNNCPFFEGGVYLIYTHTEQPNRIVAWMHM